MKKYNKKIFYNVAFRLFSKINDAIILKENSFSFIYLHIKRRYLFRLKDIFLPVMLLKGKEKHSYNDITVLYCGDIYSLHFITDILFEGNYKKEYLGTYFFLNLKKILSVTSNNADITIIKTDRFFSRILQKRGYMLIPAWINMKIDTSKSFEEIAKKFKKSAKEDVRKIKKFNYTYEITKDLEKFDRFFYEIRDPHFKRRVGSKAIPGTTSYLELKIAFRLGSLFTIKDGDQTIAGFIVVNDKKKASPHFMGIIGEKELYKAAGSALFYFFIEWAKENGISLLNFGLSRPFLNDGPFRFKRKWGMTVDLPKRFFDIFALKVNGTCSAAILSFFENNPFLILENKELDGFVFSHVPLSHEEQKKIFKGYYIDGITTLNIVQTEKQLKSFLKKKL